MCACMRRSLFLEQLTEQEVRTLLPPKGSAFSVWAFGLPHLCACRLALWFRARGVQQRGVLWEQCNLCAHRSNCPQLTEPSRENQVS